MNQHLPGPAGPSKCPHRRLFLGGEGKEIYPFLMKDIGRGVIQAKLATVL
jgi:hypothetical protein